MARARAAARRDREPRPRARAAAARLPASSSTRRGSTRACCRACCARPTRSASRARTRGRRARPAPVPFVAARRRCRSARATSSARTRSSRLFRARGEERQRVFAAADALRREVNGDVVTYVVTRNIQYTNVCYFRCGFCAFSKGKLAANLRGAPYLVPHEEIVRRAIEAWERGATEVCLQGGIHPAFDGDYYASVVRAIKDAVPELHVHAFSRARDLAGRGDARRAAARLPRRGCATRGSRRCPGTAAEVLDDEVRAVICPDKITTAQWLEVHETAHGVGLRSNNTIMFGHVDGPRNWARHLVARARAAAANGRLHRVRAAPVRAHGGADLPAGPRAPRADVRRGAADARGRRGSRSIRGSRTCRSRG